MRARARTCLYVCMDALVCALGITHCKRACTKNGLTKGRIDTGSAVQRELGILSMTARAPNIQAQSAQMRLGIGSTSSPFSIGNIANRTVVRRCPTIEAISTVDSQPSRLRACFRMRSLRKRDRAHLSHTGPARARSHICVCLCE